MNETIEYYNQNADTFYETTVSVDMSRQHEKFLSYLPKEARILDCGCGSGRDSKSFLDKGYQVLSIDGSQKLCDKASSLTGQKALCKQFGDIAYQNEFDGIWACASLLHVQENELAGIFYKLSQALKPDGIMYCSFKFGDFSGERKGRYFTDMTEERLKNLIDGVEGMRIVEFYHSHDARTNREGEMWLNAIIKKD